MESITVFVLVACLTVAVARVEIDFQNPDDGYVLKPLYHKNQTRQPFTHAESFVVLKNRQESHLIHAKFGPFEIYQTVPKIFLTNEHNENTGSGSHYAVINNMDLNVHILDYPDGQSRSRLRVLFHIARRKSQTKISSFGFYNPGKLWCARIYMEYKSRELSSHCVIQEGERACIATLIPPTEWWKNDGTTIDVQYSITHTDSSSKCTSVSKSVIPRSMYKYKFDVPTTFLSKIAISNKTETYSVLRDHSVVINVPQQPLLPGSVLYVPISLEAGSDLKMFIVRVRARSGIKILGAELVKGTNWEVFVDVNDRQRSAAITVNIRDPKKYGKMKQSEEIVRVKLGVEPHISSTFKVCRVIWSVDKGYNTRSRSRYFLPESKMVSRFQINVRNSQKIAAVLSVSDILNTAVLTGIREQHRMYVYLVSDDSHLRDITNRSMCYSSKNSAVKVLSDCSHVYVDGSESGGGYNVSIIVKYGGHSVRANLNIWVPEKRLDIQLSDNKLSQVKGWRVPTSKHVRGQTRTPSTTHPHCRIKYQESILNVFTRFYIEAIDRDIYYADKRAYFRITDLVKERTRVADSRIAEIRSGVIYGKTTGRTEIQVLSPYGRVLGASEVRVLRDRVTVDRINAIVVTGITMDILQSRGIYGAMDAVVQLDDTIRDTEQEGILSAEVQYSDKKVVPLKLMDSMSYQLDLKSIYRSVLEISSGSQPRITGLTSTRGKLIKYTLHPSNSCRRKKIRSLSTGTIQVNIRLKSEEPKRKKEVMSDAEYKLDYKSKFESHRGKDILTVTIPERDGASGVDKVVVEDDNDGITREKSPRAHAQTERLDGGGATLTPLEIGMYVLLAVFCVAISVFMVHCGVFVYRNTRKHVPKEVSPVAANDWVWLGRATLERNSIMDTRCSQALMPEEDFNGNRISRTSQSLLGDSDSSRGGISSAPSSNRNSQISTYQGHECSIRITANPFDDASTERRTTDRTTDRTTSEVSTNSSYLSPTRRSFHFPDRDTMMSMSETDHEWDYEAMGMTYDQLVDYFGNLKESSA